MDGDDFSAYTWGDQVGGALQFWTKIKEKEKKEEKEK